MSSESTSLTKSLPSKIVEVNRWVSLNQNLSNVYNPRTAQYKHQESCFPLSSSNGLCLCTKSSTQSSIFSASSVNQSHQCLCAGLLVVAAGALDVALGADAVSSSRPVAEAARLDNEDIIADIIAAEGSVEVTECTPTGSLGVSLTVSSSSLCKPTGLRGRRRVPLLSEGVKPIESHMMLYSSIFSECVSKIQHRGTATYGKVPCDCLACAGTPGRGQ